MSATDDDRLYDLLPEEFRRRDVTQGFPLLALMRVIEGVHDDLDGSIAALYSNWFVETVPLARLSALAALVGVVLPDPPLPEHRALVGNAIRSRRRKGVTAALPSLLRDASGWYSRVVTALPSPSDDRYETEIVGSVVPAGDPDILLEAWRLPVFAASGIAATAFTVPDAPAGLEKWFAGRRYMFNALGRPQPLYNIPVASLFDSEAGAVDALPIALTPPILSEAIDRYNRAYLMAGVKVACPPLPADATVYGPAAGLLIRLVAKTADGTVRTTSVPPADILAVDLSVDPYPVGDVPLFVTGPIDVSGIARGSAAIDIVVGGVTARATITMTGSGNPTIAALASALQSALRAAVPAIPALAETLVQPFGVDTLAILPGGNDFTATSFTPDGDLAKHLMLTAADDAGYRPAIRSMRVTDRDLFELQTSHGTLTIGDGDTALAVPMPPPSRYLPLTHATLTAYLADEYPAALFRQLGRRLLVAVPPSPASAAPPRASNATRLLALERRLGLVPMIAVDPLAGILVLPAAKAATTTVLVDYGHAFPAAIGGGSYPRSGMPMPADDPIRVPAQEESLDAALAAWTKVKPPTATIILSPRTPPALSRGSISMLAGQSLTIMAVDRTTTLVSLSRDDPTLRWLGSEDGVADAALDGIVVDGNLTLGGGLVSLRLSDCTLVPASPTGAPAGPPAASLTVERVGMPVQVTLQRCIAGAIRLSGASGRSIITDSIVGGLSGAGTDPIALTWSSPSGPAAVTIERTTLIGESAIDASLTATDTLFAGALVAQASVTMRCCFVSLAIIGPRAAAVAVADITATPAGSGIVSCTTCGQLMAVFLRNAYVPTLDVPLWSGRRCRCATPTDTIAPLTPDIVVGAFAAGVPRRLGALSPPLFYDDDSYPLPDFARPSLANAPELLNGSTSGGEIGAYGIARADDRHRMFVQTLAANLPLAAACRIRYRS